MSFTINSRHPALNQFIKNTYLPIWQGFDDMLRSFTANPSFMSGTGNAFSQSLGRPKAPKPEPQRSGKASFSGMFPRSISTSSYIPIHRIAWAMTCIIITPGKSDMALAGGYTIHFYCSRADAYPQRILQKTVGYSCKCNMMSAPRPSVWPCIFQLAPRGMPYNRRP